MKYLRIASKSLLTLERGLVVGMLAVMVMLAFLQVILRNVFGTGILWADPFLRHLVLWIGFIGASIATQSERHIGIDILTRFLSERLKHLARSLTHLFAAAVCIVLAEASYRFVVDERDWATSALTIGSFEIPTWQLQIIIPVGFALMGLRFLIQMSEHFHALFSSAPSPPAGETTR